MLEQKIIDFIKKTIENYDSDIENTRQTYNSSIDKYAEELKQLRENPNSILDIDIKVFEDILEESLLNDLIKEKIISSIKSIKFILESNSKNNTTFRISSKQKESLEKFFEIVEQIRKDNNSVKEAKEKEIEKLKLSKNKLAKIQGILEDPNNFEFIEDIDVIVDAIKNSSMSIDEKKDILYSILVYNNNIHNSLVTSNNHSIPLKLKRLNINDVRTLFDKYGYDFDQLHKKEQDDILAYGDLKNMDEVFDCLVKNRFPKFSFPTDSLKISRILINCDQNTITSIVNFSKIRGLNSNDLLKIIPALIKQRKSSTKRKKQHKTSDPNGGNNDSPIVPGKSDDYVKNINFLEKLGFNIREVFDKCPHILTTTHERLVNNYNKFRAYNLSFKQNAGGTLTCPSLSFLGLSQFEETIDQFIETSPYGYDYIKENLSRLAIADSKDLIFYKIYASYMNQNSFGSQLTPEGPFVFNTSRLLLRGEITQDNVPYRGLNELNKKTQTMTIDQVVKNKDIFDKAIKDKEASVDFLSFKDSRLTELEKYIDPNNPLVYDFNETRISVLKVKRILYLLNQGNVDGLDDSLLYAITYNTIIDQNNFDKIKNIVKSRRI